MFLFLLVFFLGKVRAFVNSSLSALNSQKPLPPPFKHMHMMPSTERVHYIQECKERSIGAKIEGDAGWHLRQ